MEQFIKKTCFGVKEAGFTLIELLVVVLIVGILAAAAVLQYTKAVEKARWSEIYRAERTIAKAQEAYRMANGEYTQNFDDLSITFPGIMEKHPNKFRTDIFQGTIYGGGEGLFGEFLRMKDGVVDYSVVLITYYALDSRLSRQCRAKNKTGDAICAWLTGGSAPSKHGSENRYYF